MKRGKSKANRVFIKFMRREEWDEIFLNIMFIL